MVTLTNERLAANTRGVNRRRYPLIDASDVLSHISSLTKAPEKNAKKSEATDGFSTDATEELIMELIAYFCSGGLRQQPGRSEMNQFLRALPDILDKKILELSNDIYGEELMTSIFPKMKRRKRKGKRNSKWVSATPSQDLL